MAITIALACVVVLAGAWLGWQLLRQNGRILLRLDELEKRLDQLEFGGADEPEGLLVGTDAPAFELPDLAGQRRSLGQFRGQSVLLIFFNPACGFCRDMAPRLARSPLPLGGGAGGQSPSEGLPQILIVSTGSEEANRQLFNEHKVTHPVLLQKEMEVAATYKANGTPSGYFINAEGKIASGLAMGADALLRLAEGKDEGADPEAHVPGNGGEREDRFRNRSLARSKIKRDGLKAGTPAPHFRLPRLDGRGELTLGELRGRGVLLVFSSPGCGPCEALAPELEKFHRQQKAREAGRVPPCAPLPDGRSHDGAHGVTRPTAAAIVVMISKGEPKENRTKVREHGLTFPIVLQQQWEISRLYAMFTTPIAYLINEEGIIAHDVAVGSDAILSLLAGQNGQSH